MDDTANGAKEAPAALTAFSSGPLQVPNRIAFLATVNNLGRNLEITPEQIAFYEARARGGTGLIITEGMSVHPTSIPNPTLPLAFKPELVPGFRRLSEAVHRHDRPILGQLWHVGRQALWNPTEQPWSPSGERDPYSGSTPHVMTDTEIMAVVDGFKASAVNLKDAGFDGVELHGAHGYLINQFLSPASNRRTDRWGGSVENRARFPLELVRAIRAACGDDFVVGLKLTVHEYMQGGLDLEGSCEIVDYLADQAVWEYIAVSQANFSPSLEYHVPDQRFPDVPFEDLARGVHDTLNGRAPVMALCKVPDIATASALIERGTGELVGMVRALLADPDVVAKADAGAAARPCIYCNVCWEHIHTGRPAHCIYAPETAREAELEDMRGAQPIVAEPLRVSVLGAGPAGLEFARVAAGQGHDVAIFEASHDPGGRFRFAASVPGLESYAQAVGWLLDAAVEAGAELNVGAASSDGLDDVDLIVNATGAEPVVEPLDGASVVSLEAALADPESLTSPVFVVDEIEAEPVYAAVEHLARSHDVRLITRRASVGRRVAYISLIGLLKRLDQLSIPVHTLLVPARIDAGRLIARHAFSGREHDLGAAGTVVRAGPYQARALQLDDGTPSFAVGDASAPREALASVYEAHRRALSLGVVTPDSASSDARRERAVTR